MKKKMKKKTEREERQEKKNEKKENHDVDWRGKRCNQEKAKLA